MSDTQTPHLSLDYLVPDQAQKHVTLNDALRRLDGLVHLSVESASRTTPPATPQNGVRYLVPDTATEAWEEARGKLVIFEDTGWQVVTPREGWRLWQTDTHAMMVFDGIKWRTLGGDLLDNALNGVRFERTRAQFDFSATLPVLTIPSHRLIFGITGRIIETLTGPTNWQLGVGGGTNRYGSQLPLEAGSTINGPANSPMVYWSPAPVVLTPNGSPFTGGKLVLDVFSLLLPMPADDD